MERIVAAFTAEGADAWYSSPAARFLGPIISRTNSSRCATSSTFGSSPDRPMRSCWKGVDLPWPADLYLEGSDQHRGWFHSSLLESVGTRGVAPFKAVLTHGFVNDEHGRKMSKSLGNVVAPDEVANRYGVDILRLWVMMSDTTEDLRIGPEILKQQAELYRRLRNTLRWVLGSLAGFETAEAVPIEDMPELERYILHRMTELDAKIRAAVESYDWTGVYPDVHNFCSTDLSAFYFDIRKDAVYCDRPDSVRRRSARTVLDYLHRCLCTWLAPVCVSRPRRRGPPGSANRTACTCISFRSCRIVARRRAGGEVGADQGDPAADHGTSGRSAAGQCHRRFFAGGGDVETRAG